MTVTTDILRTWRHPRTVVRGLMAMGPREDRAVVYLLAGCFLVFVAQWPRLSRTAYLQGDEFDRLIAYEFLAWLVVWPLMFYLVAALLFLALRLWRPDMQPYQTRVALFWAFLAASPAGLLYGLTAGMIGPGPAAQAVGVIWIAAFVAFAAAGLREAGRDHGK